MSRRNFFTPAYFNSKNKRIRGAQAEAAAQKIINDWNKRGLAAIYNRELDGGEIDALIIGANGFKAVIEVKGSSPKQSHIFQLLKNTELAEEQVFEGSEIFAKGIAYAYEDHMPLYVPAYDLYTFGLYQIGNFLDLVLNDFNPPKSNEVESVQAFSEQ